MKISLTPAQAFQKIKQYCAYQERSHQATKEKLFSMGLYKKDVEILLSQLIEENYLNEQRYALQFVGGRDVANAKKPALPAIGSALGVSGLSRGGFGFRHQRSGSGCKDLMGVAQGKV